MPRSRREMEQALAESFGYSDYAAFREGVADTLGRGVLRRLEKQLDAMTEEDRADDRSTGDEGAASGNVQREPGPGAGRRKDAGAAGAGREKRSTDRG